jgi:hypothetical protein
MRSLLFTTLANKQCYRTHLSHPQFTSSNMKTLSILSIALLPGSLAFSAASPSIELRSSEIDTAKAFEESTFPIKPDDLILRAKELLSPKINLGIDDGGACLAENFEFVAAVVGPLGKEEYLNALKGFKLQDNFDITQNLFGFTVSPIQPNRVYFFSHQTAKLVNDFMGAKPEDVKTDLILPPQVHHIDLDETGKMTEFGFYTVDRRFGNTGGLGGAFGYFYGVGKPLPIPECQPYKPSFQFRTLNWIGKLGRMISGKK